MHKHHMLGIQTLGTKPGCVILEFAIGHFLDESEDRKHFKVVTPTMRHARIDIKAQVEAGSTIEFGFLKRWLDKAPLRLHNMMNDEYAETPYSTAKWFQDSTEWDHAVIWAYDPDFHCSIMDDFFTRFGTPNDPVWKFSRKRSLRTIVDTAGTWYTIASDAHSAVSAVEAQIESAIKALRILCPQKFA